MREGLYNMTKYHALSKCPHCNRWIVLDVRKGELEKRD